MAGGSLTALNKLKPGSAPDIRPIAVGEVLRRLTGKCLCAVIKHRVIEFFLSPYNLVWLGPWVQKRLFMVLEPVLISNDGMDFSVLKVNFKNAFNLVPSR